MKTRAAVLADPTDEDLRVAQAIVEALGFCVGGIAREPEEALELVRRAKPALLVTEVDFGGGAGSGVDLLQRVRAASPATQAIVFTSAPEFVPQAFAAGAVSYILKRSTPRDIAAGIRQSFERSVFHAPAPTTKAAPTPFEHELSARECELLHYVAEGLPNREIARRLWVTEQTVKFHLSSVYRKMGVANRTEAARVAQRAGLVSLAD